MCYLLFFSWCWHLVWQWSLKKKKNRIVTPAAISGVFWSHSIGRTKFNVWNLLVKFDVKFWKQQAPQQCRNVWQLIQTVIIAHNIIILKMWHLFLPDRSNSNRQLILRLLISHIYGAPSKARNANVVYIWTYIWQRWNSLFLFAAQCFNTESMQRGFLCHIFV